MDMLKQFLTDVSMPEGLVVPLAAFLAMLVVGVLCVIANIITKSVIVRYINRAIEKTSSTRDDILTQQKVFTRLSHLAPAIVLSSLAHIALVDYPNLAGLVDVLSAIYMVVVGVLFLDTLINAGLLIYRTFPISKSFPITSFTQIIKMVIYFIGAITVLSLVIGESPMTLFAGLGAMTAVLMLVFKDPILGFVAGIQLSANRMVAVGDWIEMPKFGVDGDVMEIAMTTVKIRNFDKTITTVPTQSLISDSFKNWRGMQETGGRRIKRSVVVDISTIKFCDEEMLQRYEKIQFISDYLKEKSQELAAFNEEAAVDMTALVNGRRLTNVGTFRAYIEAYLMNHPKISKSLTFLVRQLPPTEKGLPIQIYVFCLDTNWINYEKIQADIFDHILAASQEFDLRVFQNPTGADFEKL